ncbi:MAG: tetratricopeptide repeat protein [Desulfocapsaceae bacterium]|nr:tetratricopeptide repeat protein [Desulfocapsaceae bacterium]
MTSTSQSELPSQALIQEALDTASQLRQEGRIDEAEEYYQAILAIQADHPEANFSIGLLALHRNQAAAGLPYFERALDKRPEHGPFWITYIDALDRAGQTGLALETLKIASQAGLEGEEVDALRIRLRAASAAQDSPDISASRSPAQVASNGTPAQADIDKLVSLYSPGTFTDCEELARSMVTRFPDHGLTWKILGATLRQQGRLDEAVEAMRLAVILLPDDPECLNNLGIVLENRGEFAESETVLRRALSIREDFAAAQNHLGVTLLSQGRLAESEACLRRAVEIQPEYDEASSNLGINLQYQGRLAESVMHLQQAITLNPSSADALNNLGNVFHAQGRLSEAETVLRRALDLKPDFAFAYKNLGNILHCRGSLEESEQCYRKALTIKPDFSDAFQALLFVSNYHPDRSGKEIFALYQEYDQRFCLPLRQQWAAHTNPPASSRRLKVGYVSPAFCRHPASHFLEPLLEHHDKTRFEIFAYAEIYKEDLQTGRYRQHIDHWIPTIGLSDDEVARRIRRDKIDILVDLAGHTSRNRLGVFARKPAPVSLHWLDFGYTTGLTAIDYYLTDLSTAPIGSEHLFSEQLWRLPPPSFAFRPTAAMGEAGPLPAAENGFITFGTLTRAIRINYRTVRAWSAILNRVEGSRLVIDSGNFNHPEIQQLILDKFTAQGIDPSRLDVGYHSPPWDVLRSIDIGLDCFPHNSGTTLMEGLFLGIPFITLAGRSSVGRIGCSILEGAGLPEWIARTEEEYINKAVSLASDVTVLAAIRAGLRQKIQHCPLTDEPAFTRGIEDAYQQMFDKWYRETAQPDHLSGSERSRQGADGASTLYNLGVEYQQLRDLQKAKNQYIQSINSRPDFVEAYNNLGVVFQQEKRFADAEKALLKALEIRPDYTDACYNLANTYKLQAQPAKAETWYRKVIAMSPDSYNAYYNLGNILQENGRPLEAEVCLRQALSLKPDHKNAFSTLLFVLNYHPDKSAEEIFQAYQEFNSRFCIPCHPSWTPHTNAPPGNRRLKIGYVAPDYNRHPARHFLNPLLSHHDRTIFEIYAYVELPPESAATDLFQGYADHWIAAAGLTDEQLSQRIRRDAIDVLVDLAGHTADNRLGVFARKPAPVSLHWLDFGYTTGLTAIDYYLTDRISVPPESAHLFSETPWYLPSPFSIYRPPAEAGPISALPAQKKGYVTFGVLSRAVRINHRTIRVWSALLKRCPGAHLVINSSSFSEPAHQESLAAEFISYGIERDRLEIGFNSPPWDILRNIDISLDCFPHNSGTTLVESLHMGVPYVTLADRPSVGRVGSAILESAGHPEWIAQSEEEYIDRAMMLATDLDRLADLRATLRQEMQNSALRDEEGFTRNIEAAYQGMFLRWHEAGQKMPAAMPTDDRPADLQAGSASKAGPSSLSADGHKQRGKGRETRQKQNRHAAQPPRSEIQKLTQFYNRGNVQEAVTLARSLTARFPLHGFGWKVLGPLLHGQGLIDEAIQAMEQAALCLPDDPDAHYNLGIAQEQAGQTEAAELSYRNTLQLSRNHVNALYNLGNILNASDRPAEAETFYRRVLALKPNYFEARCNLGNILRHQKRLEESADCLQSALKIRPDSAEILCNLSLTYKEQEKFQEAEAVCRKALQLQPEMVEAINNLGLIYQEQRILLKAEASYRQAIQCLPGYSPAYNNLGILLQKQGRLVEAEHILQQGLVHDPHNAKLRQNMVSTLIRQARFHDAETNLRQAMELKADDSSIHSDLLFLLNYHPDKTAEEIFEEYKTFNRRFCLPLHAEWRPFTNSRDAHRRLKVGYVSPSLYRHSIRHFLEPLLSHHDKNLFEICLYADISVEDEVTARYKSYADQWIVTTNLSDAELAAAIRTDGIDILVDLAGHTGENRLGVFARKPAPVSLHWLDFGYTTGLTAIDYYLTDHTTVPIGSDGLFSERPWRLKTPAGAYRPAENIGEVGPLPAAERGYITFGTLSRASRINHGLIQVWAEILKRVEGSHLIINSGDFADRTMQTALAEKFALHGIARERLEIGFHSPPWDILRGMDIGLDCFPHSSGTTMLETIYMGVPFVTLAGRPSVGRLASSILVAVGMEDWIASTKEEYIEIAVKLAADTQQLAHLRTTLRQRVEASPQMDEPAFARKMETAYQQMFEIWAKDDGLADQQTHMNLPAPDPWKEAAAYRSFGHLKDAEYIYRFLLRQDPDNAEARYHLGLLEMTRSQPAAALPYFQAALEADPRQRLYWLACIEALEKSGQTDSAREILAIAVKAGLDGEETEALSSRLAMDPSESVAIKTGPASESAPRAAKQESRQSASRPHPDDIEELISLFNQKQYEQCEATARSLLSHFPENALAWKALGLTLRYRNRLDEAVKALKRAVLLARDDLEIYNALGDCLHNLKRFPEAVEAFKQSLAHNPQVAESHYLLANTLFAQGNLPEAQTCYEKAVQLRPDFAEALGNLGNTLQLLGRISEAEKSFEKALAAKPDFAEAFYNLGNLRKGQNRPEEAIILYRNALSCRPDYPEACSNLGIALQMLGRHAEAEDSYHRALEISPDFTQAHINLGACLKDQGRYPESEQSYREALRIQPDSALAASNLGSVLKERGHLPEAETCLRRALEIDPDFTEAHSNLLFLLNYHPDRSAEEIYAEYRNFNARFGLPLQAEHRPHTNSRQAERVVKVGYVSPQFRLHSSRHFLEPLLAHHDRQSFEIFAYADVTKEDEFSARYRSYVDHWIITADLDDAALADCIREDGIDILVDLSGHTANNRLKVFARKPAPISLHWLDFGYTTGLTAIDYYLTDEATVPPGSEGLFSELPWRLPTPSFAYRPAEGMGEISPLPAASRGYITFGTLTRAVRINHRTIRVWSEILKRVENSRLVIDSSNFISPGMQNELAERFKAYGIGGQQLDIGFHSPPWDVLRNMDIGLDCFPHNSGTTLIETLYMGVPYISLASRPSVGRIGSAILKSFGHPEWIAETEEEYVAKAVALAADPDELMRLRTSLRREMQTGPFMDEPTFVRKVESAYWEMFAQWCDSSPSSPVQTSKSGPHEHIPDPTQTRGDEAGEGRPSSGTATPSSEQGRQLKAGKKTPLKRQRKASQRLSGPQSEEIGRLVSLYQQGNFIDAEKLARSLISRFPQDSQTWKVLGALLRERGDFNEALAAMETAAQLMPKDAICLRNIAVLLCDLERFAEAEDFCRRARSIAPNYADAHNTLGIILRSQQKFPEAERSCRKALKLKQDFPEALVNLGLILNEQKRYPEAETCCHEALVLKPNFAEASCTLGLIYLRTGQLDEAESACRRALAVKPLYAAVYNSLGCIQDERGAYQEAETAYRKALEIKPFYPEALHNLGKSLSSQSRHTEAEACFRQVVEREPANAEASYNLGNSLLNQGKAKEAEISYRTALQILPRYLEALVNLGNAVQEQGALTEAETAYREALTIQPGYAFAHNNLGNILLKQGDLAQAEITFRAVLALHPDFPQAFSNLLFLLNYHPERSGQEIFREYSKFEERFCKSLRGQWRPHTNIRDPNRRLKIGYVSPEFRKHPVCNFLEPLLAFHNKDEVEVFAYAELHRGEDSTTERYRSYMDHWIPTTGMSDADMAERIRADGIDILVDLAGHSRHNRLLVFARKPAPVSLHWLDFGYTTGLKAIDYYLADSVSVPPGSEDLFSETPWNIEGPCFVYRPTEEMGEVNELPARHRGHITFGSLSRAIRINHRTVAVWAQILTRVKDARLIINSGDFRDHEMQMRVSDTFAAHGISRDRLEIGYDSPPWDVLRSMDIGLDCFPHNSGTTLIESLYMGVPFITLAGRPSVGRVGSAVLEGTGHPEWIARSEEEYIEHAVNLAADTTKLAGLRAGLRREMQAGPAMNEPAFSRKVEAAYREMFAKWCKERR